IRFKHESISALADDFRSDRMGAGDHRHSGRHRLGDYQPESLKDRRQYQHMGILHLANDRSLIQPAPVHISPIVPRQGLAAASSRSLHYYLRPWLAHALVGLHKIFDPLAMAHAAYE